MSEKDKAERLAAKLRENLRKRKAQTREMDNVLRDDEQVKHAPGMFQDHPGDGPTSSSTSSAAPQDERKH